MSDNTSGLRSQVSGFGAKHLEHFRAPKQRLPLHPLEKAVLTAVAVHLCFLPWALGTMHVWSQITSLVLATIGFLLALIPRTYSGDNLPPINPQVSGFRSQVSAMRLSAWPRLIRFPIFWIGLALLAYIAVQGFNPSWVWERNETSWWLRRVNDIEWLPTSIDTPFERFNLWRQFIIYAAAWLTLCTVWIGFTRRRSLEYLLVTISANAVIFAGTGIYRKLTLPFWDPEYRMPGFSFVLGLKEPLPGATAFASFIYKNHAGAYLVLLTAVMLLLAAWNHEKGLRQLARSTPTAIWLLASAITTVGMVLTQSRGALLTFAGFLLTAGLCHGLARFFSTERSTTHPSVRLLVTVMTLAVVGYGVSKLDYRTPLVSLTSLIEKQEAASSVAQRLDAYAAARTMLMDNWERGVGAGGFRFLFTEYIRHYPESYRNGRLFWEHAHCDWLQFPIEHGIFGACLLALCLWWFCVRLLRGISRNHSTVIILGLGLGQTLLHAVFDFPFQNPAILVTWGALAIIVVRCIELE